jgi:iron(III) transport system substrate-binding protein
MPDDHDGFTTRTSRTLTRRTLLGAGLGLAGAAVLGPWGPADAAPAGAQAAEEEKLYADAKKEGKVVWWTAHYAQSAADAVRDAFVAKYPGIEVQFIRQTAQVIYQRLTQNLKAGVREVDVFASTDEAHYVALKKQRVLAPYRPIGVDILPRAYRNIDPDNVYHVGALGFVLVNYNTKVTAPPQKWTDLLDPRWKGQITLGHPGFSGYVGNWVVEMWDKYGWDYFTKLAKNNPKIGRSVNDTVTDIVSGERLVGAGPDNYSLESRARGNPINIQFPADDASLIVSPVGILSDAPHPNAARLFESFFYTKEYSLAMAKVYNYPLRPDVAPPSGVAIDKVKWYRNKAERLATGVPEAITKWRETFGV